MAKKNSTKTVTKEALQNSEPKIQVFGGWTGMNIQEAPLTWKPMDTGYNQSDEDDTFFVIQNNLVTTSNKTVETRMDTKPVAIPPAGLAFTGISCLQEERLICAFSDKSIRWHSLNEAKNTWTNIPVHDPDGGTQTPWASINFYADTLICFTEGHECFIGDLATLATEGVSSSVFINEPTVAPSIELKGTLASGSVTGVSLCYVYTNVFGSTLSSPWKTVSVDKNPVEWSAATYMRVTGPVPQGLGITGVDIYCTLDENQDAIFVGHVNILNNMSDWFYNWLGALSDTSVWTNVSLTIPTENNTKGVNAAYMDHHDGRLYFYGGDEPYRLWIGGNPGNELSVARGTGGAFVDVEAGTNHRITHTHKFYTYNGASIITIMGGNPNTGAVKRNNLIDTNITVTNELSTKGYMTEEVSNVVGCNSYYGSGVWGQGLYSVSRYGLAITTMAMESNNQLRVQYVSDAIEPVFTDRIAERLNNARMIEIKDVIYIVLAENADELDRVVLCYDINLQAWYTFTHEPKEKVLHLINIDSERYHEGIGIITPHAINLLQTTGIQEPTAPDFDILLETGEMSSKLPLQNTSYLCQLELRFDYFVGKLDVVVEGVDYYGRQVKVEKHISHGELVRKLSEWIRVDALFESYRVTVKGPARMRLTHILAKVYQQSKKVNLAYGFDDHSSYLNRDGGVADIHHYLDSYNNLREAIVP
jgi:hypothetical protein